MLAGVLRSLTSLAVLLSAATLALGDGPAGPPIGNNRYKTVIETGPQGVDTDDYVGDFAAGDRLSVSVKSPFQSGLIPSLRVFDPTGRDRSGELAIRERAGGKKLVVKHLEIDTTGRWVVRVGSRLSTEGAYVVSFGVDVPGRTRRSDETLPAGGAERSYAVAAVPGSLLDVDVSWKKGAAPVEIVAVVDPDGAEVLGEDGSGAASLARVRRRKASLRGLPLSGRAGTYLVRVAAAEAATTYAVAIRVRPPRRPSGFRKLDGVEPHIIRPPVDPILGVAGRRIRIDSWNLSTGAAPRVLFGDARGLDVIVDVGGGHLDVTVPPGTDGALVAVTVVNPDDQASVAEGLFYYVPEPEITALTDREGNPLSAGSAEGGDLVRIEGRFLRVGQLVRFGDDGRQLIPVLRDGALEVTTPAQAPGAVPVVLTDSYDHEVRSETLFEFKARPVIGPLPFSPAVVPTDGSASLLVRGSYFEPTDTLTFDGETMQFELITSTTLRFTPPARPDGVYDVVVVDRLGQASAPEELRVKAPGIIDDVATVDGPSLGGTDVSIHGGSVVRISGSRFHSGDQVRLDGVLAQVLEAGDAALTVAVPASPTPGLVDVRVTDLLGQETDAADALRYVGYRDRSATRAPARNSVDDRSAVRGAAGDLDDDGEDDDVIIVSHDGAPGSRSERTRILIGSTAGVLADGTPTRLPSAGSDVSEQDDLRATAVALGDLDGTDGLDILIAGAHPDRNGYGDLRWLVNDGYGVFTAAEDDVPGSTYQPRVVAYDENETEHEVFGARAVRGRPSALAVGDIDGDGDDDVVVGRTSFEARHIGVDASKVDFDAYPPTISAADAAAYLVDETRLYSALRIVLNRVGDGEGLVDVTAGAVPSIEDDSGGSPRPAFHVRDLALGDLDGDDDLDIVLTWDDPTTVSAYGLEQGNGVDSARVATRVLLNDGDGVFEDATADWLPAGSDPEWFQASRLALADVDGDDDLDLVLLHESSVNAYQGGAPSYTRRALRVLRNDGVERDGGGAVTSTLGFVDVSETAVPAPVSVGSNENLRGVALLVTDVDGDGATDILVGSVSPPTDPANGVAQRALRLLSGTPGALVFRTNDGFLPPRTADSGECEDILLVRDLSPETQPAILLLSETVPAVSTGSRLLRVFDWQR